MERLQQILAAAGTVFSKYGFRKSSLEDVARAAGVSKATIYNYVEGKDELIGVVLKEKYDGHARRLAAALAEVSDPVEKLRCYASVVRESHLTAIRGSLLTAEEQLEQFPVLLKHVQRFVQMEQDTISGVLR